MFVGDHNLVRGGHPDAITLRLFLVEVELLLGGFTLTGTNLYGRGTRVRVLLNQDGHDVVSDSNSGYLWIKLSISTLEQIRLGEIVTIDPNGPAQVSRVVVLANAECKVYEDS